MKKTKTILVAFLFATLLVAPALTGINRVSAFVAEDDSDDVEDESDITDAAVLVTAGVGLIKALFCPTNPQNRCKHGVCSGGACISFRASCTTAGSGC